MTLWKIIDQKQQESKEQLECSEYNAIDNSKGIIKPVYIHRTSIYQKFYSETIFLKTTVFYKTHFNSLEITRYKILRYDELL